MQIPADSWHGSCSGLAEVTARPDCRRAWSVYVKADLKHDEADGSRDGRATPSLPNWQRLGERIRQAALAATALHLIETNKGSGGSVEETMLETSRSKPGG